MKRMLLVLTALLALPAASLAGSIENTMKSRWLGAWVVTTVDTYSDCSGMYTNNRINGNLVKSKGARRFYTGELAKVDKVDMKRSRLDVMLTLNEPILVPYHEGPFTLYREAWCKIEFEVEVPRQIVKSRDADRVEADVLNIVERYASEREAVASETWNQREREPYPEDYERTLAELEVWRANQTNLAIQAKLDHATDETTRLVDRMAGDLNYLAGFAHGVELARAKDLGYCSQLMATSLDLQYTPRPEELGAAGDHPMLYRQFKGYKDGMLLVFGLEMMRGLPNCFVPVPELPSVEVASQD